MNVNAKRFNAVRLYMDLLAMDHAQKSFLALATSTTDLFSPTIEFGCSRHSVIV